MLGEWYLPPGKCQAISTITEGIISISHPAPLSSQTRIPQTSSPLVDKSQATQAALLQIRRSEPWSKPAGNNSGADRAHCSMKLRTRSASCQMSSYCCWVIGTTICLAPRGTCVEGVFRSRSTCRVFGRASILASPSLKRSRMTKMPPAGYPAFLQYLQSGRVRDLPVGELVPRLRSSCLHANFESRSRADPRKETVQDVALLAIAKDMRVDQQQLADRDGTDQGFS